jgi:hypothetical protein
MATTARDRTARSRIRSYLAEHGPVVDPSGRATAVLKDAIGYEGSPVAFIQLVTAMDKSREIERNIRGKRTYQISGLADGGPAIAPSPVRVAAPVTHPGTSLQIEVDYDELARALLRETWRLAGKGGTEISELQAVQQERDQLIAERDEYARRLQQLSVMINGERSRGQAG